MKRVDTLKEHLRRIAADNQNKLRAKLGEKGYRAHMRRLSLKKKRKKTRKEKTHAPNLR